MVQLLLCVAAVAFAILAKNMDAGFLPQLSQAMDTVLSQGVDFSQENTFAHFAGGMVDGKEVVMTVKVGDKVIYSKYAGTEVKLDGKEMIIVRQSDILATVE